MPPVPIWLCVLIAVLAAAACAVVAFLAGVNHRKREAEATIGSAEQEAKRIVSDAIKTAEAKKKEVVLEGKDEIHRMRNESEKELNERRKEIKTLAIYSQGSFFSFLCECNGSPWYEVPKG